MLYFVLWNIRIWAFDSQNLCHMSAQRLFSLYTNNVSMCHKEIAFDLMFFLVLLMFLLNWQISANIFSDFRLELIDSDIMLSCSCCKNIIF